MYYELVDAKIRASDKDLPVTNNLWRSLIYQKGEQLWATLPKVIS